MRAFQDEYNFEMHPWSNPMNWARNGETLIGSIPAGKGQPYKINITGSSHLASSPLAVK